MRAVRSRPVGSSSISAATVHKMLAAPMIGVMTLWIAPVDRGQQF
jgi:hypothetical protein